MTEVAERVRTPRRPFASVDDAYLVSHYATESFGALAEVLDRSYGSVQQRVYHLIGQGRIDPRSRHYQPAWTEDEEERLADLWGKLSDKRIATLLGRTVWACRLKAKRLGINRKMNLWTAREVGRLFGVDGKTVCTWRERGWIAGRQVAMKVGRNRAWNFDEDSIQRFIKTKPWAYDWRRMTPSEYLTNLAKEVATRDPWLTLEEAARELGHTTAFVERWIKRGLLTCQRRPKQAQHGPWASHVMVRKADLPAFLERYRETVHRNRSESGRRRMLRRYHGEAAA